MMIDSDELADVAKTIAWYKSNFFEGCEEDFVADFMVFCWQAVDPGRVASLDLDDETVDACANMLSELKLFVDEKRGKWGGLLSGGATSIGRITPWIFRLMSAGDSCERLLVILSPHFSYLRPPVVPR